MAKIEKQPVVKAEVQVCRNCRGEGTLADKDSNLITCEVCGGFGRVRVLKEIKITIETIK